MDEFCYNSHMKILLPYKKAEDLTGIIMLTIGFPVGLLLAWLYNSYIHYPASLGEFPAGIIFILSMYSSYKIATKVILIKCEKKSCDGSLKRETWMTWYKRGKMEAHFKCRKCKHVKIVKKPFYFY
jgi:hypothetical protein